MQDVYKEFGTSKNGLTSIEAAHRLRTYGANIVSDRKKLQPVLIFFSKFRSPLLLLLIAAAIVSGALGSRFEADVILVIVFGSAFIDFFNTYQSAQAAEKLQEKVNITAAVLRNGEAKERNIHEIVPGDVFLLEAGDLIPADGVLAEAKDLFLNEGILTGESLPAEKMAGDPKLREVFLGTSVVSGKGIAIAVTTGRRTKVGNIAEKLKRPSVPTEFEKNLKEFSLFIFRMTILLVLAVIFLNIVLLGRNWLDIFLFAVAIAVGVTPELLPLIITSNLAKGALTMSEGGVIVKKLSAIHNFGSVDVLCTDKTGTLTEDRIELVRCVDQRGKEDDDVLFWGYLSSKNLTGVRNVLDKAIEEHKEKHGKIDISGWEKVDEIPFDAERRMESVIVKKGSETVLIAKGAPEEIMKAAGIHALGNAAFETYQALSRDGFRMLGVARKDIAAKKEAYEKNEERDLQFVGFLAFLDPPKKTVKDTLKKMMEHNVAIKIITGDNLLVTQKVAQEIGFVINGALTGDEIAKLDERTFAEQVELVNVFARVSPEQKEFIIKTLRRNGHVVAYMGDGVNDVLSLREADVGISVNNAVDIAKETADIILLRKGLHEIIEGIVEGRRTFANTFKYLMMALSSNFGNMFSMPAASIFLPFLPMTAPQILLNNFLYDASQVAIPFDRVEADFLVRPKKFNIQFIKKFMLIFGPLSSCFDLITFVVLFFIFRFQGAAFQTGWFLESIATQTFVVGIIRNRGSFRKTPPSAELVIAVFAVVCSAWLIPYSFLGTPFGFVRFGLLPLFVILCIVAAYLFAVEKVKKYFYAKYGSLIEK